MDDSQHTNLFTNVTFVLRPEKQCGLIQALIQYEPLSLTKLSQLLNVSQEMLISVLERKTLLNKIDAEKLVKYFCLFFGG